MRRVSAIPKAAMMHMGMHNIQITSIKCQIRSHEDWKRNLTKNNMPMEEQRQRQTLHRQKAARAAAAAAKPQTTLYDNE